MSLSMSCTSCCAKPCICAPFKRDYAHYGATCSDCGGLPPFTCKCIEAKETLDKLRAMQPEHAALKQRRRELSNNHAFSRAEFVEELRDLQKQGIEKGGDVVECIIAAYDRKYGPKSYECNVCGYQLQSHDKPKRCPDCGQEGMSNGT